MSNSSAIHVPPGRDLTIYTRLMDAALEAKAQSILSRFEDIPENASIVDIGSGTGQIAEYIARFYHNLHVNVYAVDVSHDLLDIADSQKTFIHLIYADATELSPIPDSSADVTIHGTIGHEIYTFHGKLGLDKTLSSTFRILKPGGMEVWRDFAKPSIEGPVLMKILEEGGTDNVDEATQDGFLDYSVLSTRKLFECFYEEFMGGHAFEYSLVSRNGDEYIQLPARFAHEFCLRKDYTANWRQEICEEYLYWTMEDAQLAFESAGYTGVKVYEDDSAYIRENRLRGKVALYEDTEDGIKEIEPITHMVLVARKPQDANSITKQTIPSVDYSALIDSIHVDQVLGEIRVGDRVFKIRSNVGIGSHKRGYMLDNEEHIIKIVRSDRPNVHNIFKTMQQMIDRQYILDEYDVPYMPIIEADPDGPPYRYIIQQKIPQHSLCAAQLIMQHSLTEEDVKQMCRIINSFELKKKWQIDTNPYNWYRRSFEDGSTEMTYIGGTIFLYDEQWDFKRIGLLQWCTPQFIQASEHISAIIPKASEAESFAKEWESHQREHYIWWKKYLSAVIQPQ